jgi:hypothetical protein
MNLFTPQELEILHRNDLDISMPYVFEFAKHGFALDLKSAAEDFIEPIRGQKIANEIYKLINND